MRMWAGFKTLLGPVFRATHTPHAVKDIASSVTLTHPYVICSPLTIRPNLGLHKTLLVQIWSQFLGWGLR